MLHAVFLKCAFHFLIVNQRIDQHNDYNGKAKQCHLGLHVHQNDQRSEQLDHGDQNIFGAVMQKLCNIK